MQSRSNSSKKVRFDDDRRRDNYVELVEESTFGDHSKRPVSARERELDRRERELQIREERMKDS